MSKKNYSPEQIINKLKEVEIHTHSGMIIDEAICPVPLPRISRFITQIDTNLI